MFVRKLFLILLAFVLFGTGRSLHAQSAPESDVSAIEDNSFLIEEAFNQEKNVIQHINTFSRTWNDQGWVFTYTEEWPLPGHERHQLSVTVPALESTDNPGSGGGIGDVAFN